VVTHRQRTRRSWCCLARRLNRWPSRWRGVSLEVELRGHVATGTHLGRRAAFDGQVKPQRLKDSDDSLKRRVRAARFEMMNDAVGNPREVTEFSLTQAQFLAPGSHDGGECPALRGAMGRRLTGLTLQNHGGCPI